MGGVYTQAPWRRIAHLFASILMQVKCVRACSLPTSPLELHKDAHVVGPIRVARSLYLGDRLLHHHPCLPLCDVAC